MLSPDKKRKFCRRFRELRDSHNKAMEDMAAAIEAKEQAHAQELIDLERKLLIDKGNMQKVNKGIRRCSKKSSFNPGTTACSTHL